MEQPDYAQQAADAAENSRRCEQQERDDLATLMSERYGRRIVSGILDRAGVYRLSYSTEPMEMAFREGCRNEGLRLLGMIAATCPHHYNTMLREAKEDDELNHRA